MCGLYFQKASCFCTSRKKRTVGKFKNSLEQEGKNCSFCVANCIRLNFDQAMDFGSLSECGELVSQLATKSPTKSRKEWALEELADAEKHDRFAALS